MEYQKFHIRIYEKKELDSKIQSQMIYFYLQGHHVTQMGTIINESNYLTLQTTDEIHEKVESVEVLFGSRTNFILT